MVLFAICKLGTYGGGSYWKNILKNKSHNSLVLILFVMIEPFILKFILVSGHHQNIYYYYNLKSYMYIKNSDKYSLREGTVDVVDLLGEISWLTKYFANFNLIGFLIFSLYPLRFKICLQARPFRIERQFEPNFFALAYTTKALWRYKNKTYHHLHSSCVATLIQK